MLSALVCFRVCDGTFLPSACLLVVVFISLCLWVCSQAVNLHVSVTVSVVVFVNACAWVCLHGCVCRSEFVVQFCASV